jgi:hypothetical protein
MKKQAPIGREAKDRHKTDDNRCAFSDLKRYELFTGTKSIANIRLCDRLGYKLFKELVVDKSLSLVFMEKAGIPV